MPPTRDKKSIPFSIYLVCVFLIMLDNCESATSSENISIAHIEESCIQKCPDHNRTNSEHIDCGRDCYISQCTLGCQLWDKALDSSCKSICNQTEEEDLKELYCVMGCNNAINRYFNWLIDEVGTPSAPALVADSLTATSLSLEWEIPPRLLKFTKGKSYITKSYLVQWRYEEVVGDWKFCRNQSMGDNSTVRVDNLQPYTKYRFRVALILSSNHEKELFSEQSVIISTLPMGKPLSEPAIVRAVAIDHTRISISWEPGPFPRGPILSYVLQINDNRPNGYFALKDIPATDNFAVIDKLEPSTEYSVSVKMTNTVGEGPPAMTVVRTMDAPDIPHEEPKTKLILCAEYKVLSQGTELWSDSAQRIYSSDERITGVAIHIAQKLIFVADEARYIYKAPLDNENGKKEIILRPDSSASTAPLSLQVQEMSRPLDLSMDWLNNHLYILEEIRNPVRSQKLWRISRCDLNGAGLTVVLAGLMKQPSHIEVDPYNGYLFWVISGQSDESGLFRLDLGDVSNGVKHETVPFPMWSRWNIGAFTLDYISFKILVPLQDNNTVISMDLDGKKKEDIRRNTQTPKFKLVKSLGMANQIFYWTNGYEVINEEFHETERNYYHNVYPLLSNKTFLFVLINQTSAQPIPVPINPPSNVQALLSDHRGKVTWHTPHLLGMQGKGAWQQWKYILEITNEDANNETVVHRGITGTHFQVNKLHPNTNYKFRTAAYTSAGRGPFSTEFRTRTLKSPHDRYLIWSSNEYGLLQSDVLGEHIHTLIPKSSNENQNISDITWYEDVVFFVSNSTLKYYNRTSGFHDVLKGFDSVQSIAFDWIGRRIYWFNRQSQLILRANLSGYEQEPLISLPASDTDLKIDSLHGYLYFSSGHAVEYCRLNGKNKREYYRTEVYAGKQVMGLTLDIDNQRLFWIVRGYDGSSLFMAQMPGNSHQSVQEYILKEKSLQGPLTYFSDRLLWLQDEHTIIISNITGKNLAHIRNQKLRGLKSLAIIDQTHHVYPNLPDKLNVIPEPINVSEMTIDGSSKSFNITWPPIMSVNYGEVFYEIRFLNNVVTETTDNTILYANDTLDPYTPLDISIRAYTYWASSKVSKITLYSPPAEPSTPTNPRIFVTHRHDPLGSGLNIEATFRWNAPKYPNGPISGYVIEYWYDDDDYNHSYIDIDDPNVFEKVIPNLNDNVTYLFEVRAYSAVGMGAKTSPLAVHTKNEKPAPTILASIDEGIWKIDMDLQTRELVVHTGSLVRLLTSIQLERTLYWIDDNNNLMSYDKSNKAKLTTLPTEPLALTVDWIERVLYWSQRQHEGSVVFALDLNSVELKPSDPKFIMDRRGVVNSLAVSPKDRLLFWVETTTHDQNNGILMTKSLDDDTVKPFFPDVSRSIYKTFSLDTSSDNTLGIIWRGNSTQLFTTDINHEHSWPIDIFYNESQQNLVKDSGRLYWTENGKIHAYSVYANDHHEYVMNAPNANRLFAFFHQNYLDQECMIPLQGYSGSKYKPDLIKGEERSLLIRLPESEVHPNCNGRSPPGVLYTILYTSAGNVRNCTLPGCKIVKSLNKRELISGLKPFVRYRFQIGVNNYYGKKMGIPSIYGPVVAFNTSIGFPSAPRNVQAEVISPSEVIVQWHGPIELNSDSVWYEVHWETQNAINRVKNRQQQFALDQERFMAGNDAPIMMNITKLLPSQPYKIWVRAYTSNSTFNESDPVQIETISEPGDITLTDRSPYDLHLHWMVHKNISKYIIEYQAIGSDVPIRIEEDLLWKNNSDIAIHVDNLKPKTQYKFSILLYFLKRDVAYTWPPDSRFVFETLGDRPTSPGIPLVIHVSGDVFKVYWQPSMENGAPILEYSLEAQQLRVTNRVSRSTDDVEIFDSHTTAVTNFISKPLEVEEPPMPDTEWRVYYNGTDSYWIIQDLQPIDYAFRCRSRNSYGWSPYSAISEPITGPYVTPERQTYIMVAICVPIAVAIVIIVTSIVVMAFRRKSLKKNLHGHSPRIPDVELATLRELPRGANLIHSNNILYTHGPLTDTDIALLPQIRRDQITMTSFLGSGAFGEVYEGIVKTVNVEDAETRVAIKTLRKGATAQEKSEFLQEAHLMSNFKHDHILRLIGVCFDMETLYIIMELMQGGDLLSFLRQSRPSVGIPSSLTLLDLVSMCVDIAAGCRYLEEMHFVHRDLACRNCLVSSVDPANRVVKIGDFGLARDIYKNDYYRKDGEGLLPVRWMSPESLVDGVFTSQSDIWAFGVLCWEILTLGQQPYPARNNLEVLHYVRDGGRLGKPSDCPTELYNLMQLCWSYEPDERPTFRYCLEILEKLKECTNDKIRIQARNLNKSDGTLKFCCDDHDLVEPPAIATPTSSNCSPIQPQYLEVLHNEENDPIIRSSFGDGYEIPVPDVDQSLTNSTSSFINNGQTLSKDCLDKERTFSSSSTVSETSIVCVQPPPPPTSVQPAPIAQPLSAHTILKVALPNMKEDCTSDESLLTTVPMHNADKVKPIYTNSKVDEVLNHDGKTIL
ncbi:protein sevenless isoform X3 [Bradysia coprophila]|uniref:protein sevenless isoform X3 n=1 Tax=Bradysia coprophila TaxID=38358 RepID=UPI00187D84F9|nr:protein sevenless isoform X3 [Bradysia coprophila]